MVSKIVVFVIILVVAFAIAFVQTIFYPKFYFSSQKTIGGIFPSGSQSSKAQIGIFYEPWFVACNTGTYLDCSWNKIPYESVPLLGLYNSLNQTVVDQHLDWLNAMGISFIMVDLSNHPYLGSPVYSPSSSWYNPYWNNQFQVIDFLANRIQAKGYNIKLTFLLGGNTIDDTIAGTTNCFVGNAGGTGPCVFQKNATGQSYANDWLNFIYTRWSNVMLQANGKPYVSWYLGTPQWVTSTTIPSVSSSPYFLSDGRFTIRYVTGYGDAQPLYYQEWAGISRGTPVVNTNGASEIVAITGAYPGSQGWSSPDSVCWNNGQTLLNQWNFAITDNTQLILISQFNEFAEQNSTNCSNDIEPAIAWGYDRVQFVGNLIVSYLGLPPPIFTTTTTTMTTSSTTTTTSSTTTTTPPIPSTTTTTSTSTTTTSTTTTSSTTTTTVPCVLQSVSLTPQCNTSGCQSGDSIRVDASYSGSCPSVSYFQIDLHSADLSCYVYDQDRSICPSDPSIITGIQVQCTSSPCTAYWTIPSIPTNCQGETMTANDASLRNYYACGGGTGYSSVTPSGSFTFYSPSPTTTTTPEISSTTTTESSTSTTTTGINPFLLTTTTTPENVISSTTTTTTPAETTIPSQPCSAYDIPCWIGYYLLKFFGLVE